jgi:hypothetical protein
MSVTAKAEQANKHGDKKEDSRDKPDDRWQFDNL